MNDQELLAKAISIAARSFESVLDKGGNPYILHCLAVMDGVKHLGPRVMSAAVLHDLLEDCPQWTAQALEREGLGGDILEMIQLMTHSDDEDYMSYVHRISHHKGARAIKIADLTHNMNPSRLPSIGDQALERLKKYHKAYQFLVQAKTSDS